MSSLMQIALLVPAHHVDQIFLIIATHAEQLKLDLGSVLKSRGLQFSPARFVVHEPSAEELDDPAKLAERIKGLQDSDNRIAGAIFDCGQLIRHADRVRAISSFSVFDQITCLDFLISASSDNPYFGTSYGTGAPPVELLVKAKRQLMSPSEEYVRALRSRVNGQMKVGILRIDYDYPPIPGDIACEASYGYQVVFAKVEGLTFEMAQRAVLDDHIMASFQKAVAALEAESVVAITGDCGFMMAYQPYVRALTKLPVILSSIIQAPAMAAMHSDDAVFALLTANSRTFDKKRLLSQSGVNVDLDNWVLVGLQDVPGFEAVALGEKVPAEKVQPSIAAMCRDLQARHPKLAGFLLECTELPHYADEIRAKTGLPVFDAITLVDYFQVACCSPPSFSQSVLEGVVGALDPRVAASAVAQITFGILGTVVMVPVVVGTSAVKQSSCCTVL